MNERIKELRKTLGFTQTEFGIKIGVKGNTVTGYETGVRAPSDTVITLICREFHVNEAWLREGTGEMFARTVRSAAEELAAECGADDFLSAIIQEYMKLTDSQRRTVRDFVYSIAEKSKPAELDVDAAVAEVADAARRELVLEKNQADGSSPSHTAGTA